jgi:sugar fermentation stimulation protein A
MTILSLEPGGLGLVGRAEIFVGDTLEARLLQRPNRFLLLVVAEGETFECFLPNPGRMGELLFPGATVLLKEVRKDGRKTAHDVVGVMRRGERVSIDTRVPNQLVGEALRRRALEQFGMYDMVRPEYGYGRSRFDFLLQNSKSKCLLEVKSCTLVVGRRALFPDAPTERGARHLVHLTEALGEGYRCCVLFVLQGTCARVFSPNTMTDPKFGNALREAAREGVEVYAHESAFEADRIVLGEPVEVDLAHQL